MNPLPIAVLLLISQGQGIGNTRGRGMQSLKSLDVEPVLNELHRTVGALERINRMNQIVRMPMTLDRAPELLEAIDAPPEIRNLIQAGSALMAKNGRGLPNMQAQRALPQYDMYDDRDPYVTGEDYGSPSAGNYAQPAYGNAYNVPYESPQTASPSNAAQMPDLTQLMQTFGPMLKTFMQGNNG
ncbi:MAG: hypothetical protein HFG67_03460 [Firmicutes bacterium]|nr:hypothetical protein [Bacillota bacterium]